MNFTNFLENPENIEIMRLDGNATINETFLPVISITTDLPYYGKQLAAFKDNYSCIHGYLSVAVCSFGIIANILNIIVLTRKDMISPTNTILTGLAVADMLVMISYLAFASHNYIRTGTDTPDEVKYSYAWAVFTLFHANFTIVCHTISTWLTVTLAVWRYMAVSYPANSKKWCSMPRAKFAIACTYIYSAVFCIPTYLTFEIDKSNSSETYNVALSEISQMNNKALQNTNFWIFSVLTKLIPCILLTGLSLGLIRILYEADQRKQRLKNRIECDKSCDRTTKMLLAVLLLFLITEIPSGILALLSGILGDEFFQHVYLNFGEVMDGLALINSAINFILYCTMSRQFRETFSKLFTPKIVYRWVAVPTELTTTCATTCV